MNSSKTGIPLTDVAHSRETTRAPTGDNVSPANRRELVESPPLEVTEFEPPPRTITEFIESEPGVPFNDWPMFPNPFRQPLRCARWLLKSAFCIAVLIVVLAVVAVVPIASIFVLGYMLEVEGRVARSGRLRDGFPLLPLAPRIGSIAVGIGLWLLPLFFIAGMVADAALIEPTGLSASRWLFAKVVVGLLTAAHLCLALARGGSFGCFFRPIKNLRWFLAELRNRPIKDKVRCPDCGQAEDISAEHCSLCGFTPLPCGHCGESPPLGATVCAKCGETISSSDVADSNRPVRNLYWHRADRKVRKFAEGFRLRHHFVLGGRGMIGAAVILLLPTLMFAAATNTNGPLVLLTVLGGICLSIVFLYIPFLQARLAAENRSRAMFELREVRSLYPHAPIAWFLSLLLVFALTLPFHLASAFAYVIPGDALWMLMLVFVISIYPAKVATGWAYARAARKQREGKPVSHWAFRHGCRLLMFSTTVVYTLIFFFTRNISAEGRLGLFEHHTFLGTTFNSVFRLGL